MCYELPTDDPTTPAPDTWPKIRAAVYERDHGQCHVCCAFIPYEAYECGHIVDRVAGGSDHPANLVTMCVVCNRLKPVHDTRHDYEQWVFSGAWQADMLAFALRTGQARIPE